MNKQNQLLSTEADVDIMKRSKEVELQKMDIDYERTIKENQMLLKKKELDVNLRMQEIGLQIQEEKKRTELMEIKQTNVVKEGAFEGSDIQTKSFFFRCLHPFRFRFLTSFHPSFCATFSFV